MTFDIDKPVLKHTLLLIQTPLERFIMAFGRRRQDLDQQFRVAR